MTRKKTELPVTQMTVGAGNWDATRKPITKVVIHTIVGTITGANARFNKVNEQASAHYGIGLDGKIYQWVNEDLTAYHCGKYATNQESIGIEHEDGTNPSTNPTAYDMPRPEAVYVTSIKLVADICKFYGIPADRAHIVKHNEISATHCPGTLDIERIVLEVAKLLSAPVYTKEYVQGLEKDRIAFWQKSDKMELERNEALVKLKEVTEEFSRVNGIYSGIKALGIEDAEGLISERTVHEADVKTIRGELAVEKELHAKTLATMAAITKASATSVAEETDAQQELKDYKSVVGEIIHAFELPPKTTGASLVRSVHNFLDSIKKGPMEEKPVFDVGKGSPIVNGKQLTWWDQFLQYVGIPIPVVIFIFAAVKHFSS